MTVIYQFVCLHLSSHHEIVQRCFCLAQNFPNIMYCDVIEACGSNNSPWRWTLMLKKKTVFLAINSSCTTNNFFYILPDLMFYNTLKLYFCNYPCLNCSNVFCGKIWRNCFTMTWNETYSFPSVVQIYISVHILFMVYIRN